MVRQEFTVVLKLSVAVKEEKFPLALREFEQAIKETLDRSVDEAFSDMLQDDVPFTLRGNRVDWDTLREVS